MERIFKIAIILWSASALSALAGWKGSDVWPSSNQTTFEHVSGHTKSYWWQNDCYSAIVERVNAASNLNAHYLDRPPTLSWWRFERQMLVNFKTWIANSCGKYIDTTKAPDATSFAGWHNGDSLRHATWTLTLAAVEPAWNSTSLCAAVGAPTNYLTSTPWRTLGSDELGWKYMQAMITNLYAMRGPLSISNKYKGTGASYTNFAPDCPTAIASMIGSFPQVTNQDLVYGDWIYADASLTDANQAHKSYDNSLLIPTHTGSYVSALFYKEETLNHHCAGAGSEDFTSNLVVCSSGASPGDEVSWGWDDFIATWPDSPCGCTEAGSWNTSLYRIYRKQPISIIWMTFEYQ